MRPLKERQILPKEPTNVTLVYSNKDGSKIETCRVVALHSVRDGFAWTNDGGGGPFCLDGGWLMCLHPTTDEEIELRLSDESLALCKAMLPSPQAAEGSAPE